jgi:hypothetical protein
MLSFTEFIKENDVMIEDLLQSNIVLSIIEEYNESEEELTEASFQFGGKTYKTAWGKYSCDGKPITRDEYLEASKAYKNSNKIGYRERIKNTINKNDSKIKNPMINNRVNLNDIVKKYKDFDWDSIDDYDEMVDYKHAVVSFKRNSLEAAQKARELKLLKTYVESPEKLSKKQKEYVEDGLNHFGYGKKNKVKLYYDWIIDYYNHYKNRANNNLDDIRTFEAGVKSGKIKINND